MTDSKEIDWGGNAFPTQGGADSGLYPDPGMSLRDWFAGQALPAIISKIEGDTDSEEHLTQVIGLVAKAAYRIADAMIAARKQKGSCNG